jgi:hypothetical protein
MQTSNTDRRDRLAGLFRILSAPARIHALELIKEGKSLDEIAKLIGMTRTGFQRVLNDFQSIELIEPTGHRSYRHLSVKGQKILDLLGETNAKLDKIEMEYRKSKLGGEIESFLPLAERSFPAPAVSKLKEAWDSIKGETRQSDVA